MVPYLSHLLSYRRRRKWAKGKMTSPVTLGDVVGVVLETWFLGDKTFGPH